MSWMTLETDFGNGRPEKDTRFIPDSCAEEIDHQRRYALLDLQQAKSKLQDIDDKILQLALEREYAIKTLEDAGNKALGNWLCTSNALVMVAAAYKRLGWKSKLACAFVKYLRSILFDDDDEKVFNDIICYGIHHDSYAIDYSVSNALHVVFGPKNYDLDKVFEVRLVGEGAVHFDWKNQFIETNIKVVKLVDGSCSWNSPLIAKSPRLVDIRKAICKFVKTNEHEELSYGPSERDNLEMIIGSLAGGGMRDLKAEQMFGFESDKLASGILSF